MITQEKTGNRPKSKENTVKNEEIVSENAELQENLNFLTVSSQS